MPELPRVKHRIQPSAPDARWITRGTITAATAGMAVGMCLYFLTELICHLLP